jgi:hypothetical protein
MLASINPLGERARHMRWGRTVGWYFAGSIAGGLVIGGLAGGLGTVIRVVASPTPTVVGALAVAACLVGLALDLHLGGLAIPTVHRQVDQNWLPRYRGWVYGGGFGFQLGLGVVTIVTTSTIYVALALAVLTGSWAAGLAIGAVFGLVRALPILLVARVRQPAHLREIVGRVQGWSRAASQAVLVCLIVVATSSAALLVS